MKKIIYRTLLISLFIIVIFNIKSFATSDFSYTLDANGKATITAYNGTESNLTIPSTIDGHNVVTIGEHAFNESRNSTNGSTIKHLVISEGIEWIELLAFAKCASLETVKLPESLTFLDMQTFMQCSKLKSINIPSKIQNIGNCTFQETGLTEFDIPENVKSIDTRALGICSSLEKVRVYSKDISYASGVFEYGSSNLVLYSYEGSTTQTYAQQNGIKFEILSSEKQEETITNDFELSSCSSSNGEVQYGVYVKEDDEYKMLSIKATDYNLPSNLYDYKDDIRLRITYSKVDYEVLDCKVINYKTGEVIEDLSEENINKLFNIEYGKTIIEKNWTDVIKLSELKENGIYKYTATSTIQFPEIENDIGKNCIIYIKEWHDDTYKKQISMYKNISSSALSASFNEYNSGDAFCIMYKKVENDELLKLIPKDDIIYLSNYKNGDKLEYEFEKYIYNDTENNITINIKNKAFGVETSDSVVMGKWEIYGFDWMIDSATISYLEDINNEENDKKEQDGKKEEESDNKKQDGKTEKENDNQKQDGKNEEKGNQEEKNTKDENKPIEQTKGDNTQATVKLPQAGENMRIIFVILFVIIFAIISYKKYYKLKDIK